MYDVCMKQEKDWVDNLKELMDKDKTITPSSIAHLMNKTPGAINHYLNRRRSPPLKELEKLAFSLGVKPKDFIYGSTGDSYKIPLFAWQNLSSEPIDKIIPPLPVSKNAYALRVEDESMCTTNRIELSFPPGTIIVVDPAAKVQMGRFVIAKHKETGIILFRKFMNMGLSRRLMPLNPHFDNCGYDEVDILGVVVASMNLDL